MDGRVRDMTDTIVRNCKKAKIDAGVHGVMVAARGERTEPVPLEKVAGKTKQVPANHPWVESARRVGTCLGD
jgi:ATP-dependent phosphofructokinase / diphosphate-dependent phosphofructokinase